MIKIIGTGSDPQKWLYKKIPPWILLLFCLYIGMSSMLVFAADITNLKCPVMEGEPIDQSIYTDYNGQRVYFCCERCKTLFMENPEAYLYKLPQFAALKEEAAPAPVAASPENAAPAAQPEPPIAGTRRLIRFAGRFHPIVVHFPIALAWTALLGEFLGLIWRKPALAQAGKFCLILAMISGFAAAALGLAAEASAHFSGTRADVLEKHEMLGIAAGIAMLVTSILALWPRHVRKSHALDIVYGIGLVCSVLLVSAAGYFGGILVYGAEHFRW